MPPEHPQIGPANSAELPAAFGLIFARLGPADQAERVERALSLVARGQLDPAGVLVARAGGAVAGAVVCATVPGAGSLIWPPAAATAVCEDELVRAAGAWLRGRGAALTQCLLEEGQRALAAPLLRNGYAHITTLIYLTHDLDIPLGLLATPSRLRFSRYEEAPGRFAEALMRTYEQTRDCPEVEGARTADEVIEGHGAQGRSGPRHWWLAWRGPEAVGVVVLADGGEGEWELAYVGVVPEARRAGAGREMLLHALCEAKAGGASGLTLCVDERNVPARRLYGRAGMAERERRGVYLAVWRGAGGGCPA